MSQSLDARMQSLLKKEEALKKQKAMLKKQLSTQARKARTHRLITVGGLVEKYAGEIHNLEAFEAYVKQYTNAIKRTQDDTTAHLSL